MIADILPVKQIQERYHAWKEWPKEMRQQTKGLPVVFSNSYQRASKYWFYSGQMSLSQNWYRERRNNYNFWPVEDSMLGKPVYFMDKYSLSRFRDSLHTPIGWMGFLYDSSFVSFSKVKISTVKKITAKAGESFVIKCNVQMPQKYEIFIRTYHSLSDTTRIGVFAKMGWLKDIPTSLSLKKLIDEKEFQLTVNPGLEKGKYYLRFAIQNGNYGATHNSEKIELIID